MKVELLHNTPLWVASTAIRTCWSSGDKSDTEDGQVGEKDKALIERVGNKFKHKSTLEHLVYTFFISGISRAALQELARHRTASLSVKSSRYTLKELKNSGSLVDEIGAGWKWAEVEKFCVLTDDHRVNAAIALALFSLKEVLEQGVSNDIAKYCLPDSYKTELTWTMDARNLQNFLSLRTSKAALKEMQTLAHKIFETLPEEHKYMFVDFVEEEV